MRARDLPPISQTHIGQLQAAIEDRDAVIRRLTATIVEAQGTIERLRVLLDERDMFDATRELWR